MVHCFTVYFTVLQLVFLKFRQFFIIFALSCYILAHIRSEFNVTLYRVSSRIWESQEFVQFTSHFFEVHVCKPVFFATLFPHLTLDIWFTFCLKITNFLELTSTDQPYPTWRQGNNIFFARDWRHFREDLKY